MEIVGRGYGRVVVHEGSAIHGRGTMVWKGGHGVTSWPHIVWWVGRRSHVVAVGWGASHWEHSSVGTGWAWKSSHWVMRGHAVGWRLLKKISVINRGLVKGVKK